MESVSGSVLPTCYPTERSRVQGRDSEDESQKMSPSSRCQKLGTIHFSREIWLSNLVILKAAPPKKQRPRSIGCIFLFNGNFRAWWFTFQGGSASGSKKSGRVWRGCPYVPGPTLNPKPDIPNPKAYALNPKPQAMYMSYSLNSVKADYIEDLL